MTALPMLPTYKNSELNNKSGTGIFMSI